MALDIVDTIFIIDTALEVKPPSPYFEPKHTPFPYKYVCMYVCVCVVDMLEANY